MKKKLKDDSITFKGKTVTFNQFARNCYKETPTAITFEMYRLKEKEELEAAWNRVKLTIAKNIIENRSKRSNRAYMKVLGMGLGICIALASALYILEANVR